MPNYFISDGLLWTSIKVAIGALTYLYTPLQLLSLRYIIEPEDEEKVPGLASKQTERALDLESLSVLTKSPDASLRVAAAKVLSDRLFDSDRAWNLLLQDLASKDRQQRSNALALIDIIKSDGSVITHPRFFTKTFLSALVKCLKHCLPDFAATQQEKRYPTDTEKTVLGITSLLLQSPSTSLVNDLIGAGLIDSWLKSHPFSDNRDPDRTKAEVVQDLVKNDELETWQTSHIRSILVLLAESNPGVAGLVAAGLLKPEPKVEGLHLDHARRTGESQEEIALRRRRREAIVVGEEVLQQGEEIRDLAAEHVLSQLRHGQEERQHLE